MKNYNQKFEIFGRKKGRKHVKRIQTELLNKYILNISSHLNEKKIILDIGSGNGENAIFLSEKFSDHLIIASDIYNDGNVNLCKKLYNRNINNVKIFNQNILLLLEKININNLITEIWILFPDPWPKLKHHKRRLINSNFVKKIGFLLNKNNKIYIVTDCKSYLISILKTFFDSKLFEWTNNLPFMWDYGLNLVNKTKYFEKALINKKKSFILIFKKI